MISQHYSKINKTIGEDLEKDIYNDAKIMYEKIFTFKFLPPGRGLWSMGTDITHKKHLFAALNNCAFVSTGLDETHSDPIKPFLFMMDGAMLGVGVGFDTKASNNNIMIKKPDSINIVKFIIPDSREGWVESVRLLLESFILGNGKVEFDYSKIRKAGCPLKTFGGVSSGPEPLKELHRTLDALLSDKINDFLNSRLIVDIMNIIGRCVIAGNISKLLD